MKHLIWFVIALGAAYGTQQYYQKQYEPQLADLQARLDKAGAQQKEAAAEAATAQAKLGDLAREASDAGAGLKKAVQDATAAKQAYEEKIKSLSADLAAARAGARPGTDAPAPAASAAPSPVPTVETAESRRIAGLQERLAANVALRDKLQATLAQKKQDLISWQAQGANHAKGTDLPVQIGTLQKQLDDVLGEIEVVQKQLPAGN